MKLIQILNFVQLYKRAIIFQKVMLSPAAFPLCPNIVSKEKVSKSLYFNPFWYAEHLYFAQSLPRLALLRESPGVCALLRQKGETRPLSG